MTAPKFKITVNDDYEVLVDGQIVGYVRQYWDGWYAHALNGKDLSGYGHKTRKSAALDIPAVLKGAA